MEPISQGKLGTSYLEMELSFKMSWLLDFRELIYNGTGLLTEVNIWKTSAKVDRLFNKVFTYNGDGWLIQTVLTRESDSMTLTKDFTYDGDNYIIAVERS